MKLMHTNNTVGLLGIHAECNQGELFKKGKQLVQ